MLLSTINHKTMKHLVYGAIIFLLFLASSFVALITPIKLKADEIPLLKIVEIAAHEPGNLEWIKIQNQGETDIDLLGLKFIEDETNHSTTFENENTILTPQSFALIVNNIDDFLENFEIDESIIVIDSSWQSLKITGEPIGLKLNNQILDELTYPEFTENESLKLINGTWTHHETQEEQIDEQEMCTIQVIDPPNITLSEVSLKDSTKDWIEIELLPGTFPINLSELFMQIDNKLINLGNEEITEPKFLTIETELVGTTEQILLIYEDEFIDAVCWQNSNPPQSELTETEFLIENSLWQNDCLNSDEIKNNQSIAKINKSKINNSSNWQIFKHPTPNLINVQKNSSPIPDITIQTGKPNDEIPFSINLDGSKSIDPDNDELTFKWTINQTEFSTKANPDSLKIENEGLHEILLEVTDSLESKSIAKIYVNAYKKETTTPKTETVSTTQTQIETASNKETEQTTQIENNKAQIAILSFLPNPKGSDTGQEWIEIINLEQREIDISNWQIDDEEGESKPYTISNVKLAPNESIKFLDEQTKIVLNNNEDSVRLIKPNKEVQEVINYSNAEDDEIFSKNVSTNDWSRLTASASPEIKQTTQKEVITANLLKSDDQKTSTISKTKTGQQNDRIEITELLPNPKGVDKNVEWIELYNPTENDTDLTNWQFKINEKTETIEDIIIKANSYTKIDIKSALPNTNAEIILQDYSEKDISKVEYEKATEDQSLAKINNEWQWTKSPTPGEQNPLIKEINGTITSVNQESQTLEFNSNNKIIQIFFDQTLEDLTNYQAKLKVLESKDSMTLIEILSLTQLEPEEQKSNIPYEAIPLIPASIGAYIFREKLKDLFINLTKK